MPNRSWLPLALCAIAVGLLAGASVGRSAQGDAARTGAADQRGGTLRLSSVADIGSTDPALAYRAKVWMLEYATCAKLYSYPDKPAPDGYTVVPEVAKDVPRLSNGDKTATIELKRTYRFSTGAQGRRKASSPRSTATRSPRSRRQSGRCSRRR
jgi:peptide/nickel transport system substrate-binding protein